MKICSSGHSDWRYEGQNSLGTWVTCRICGTTGILLDEDTKKKFHEYCEQKKLERMQND